MDHSLTAVMVLSSFVCIWKLRWNYVLSAARVFLSVSRSSPLQFLSERKSNAGSIWEFTSLVLG